MSAPHGGPRAREETVKWQQPAGRPGEPLRPETDAWWRQAQRDLETARHLVETGDYYAAVFFCQQAAEKGLKALRVERDRRLPEPTHTLLTLARGLDVPKEHLSFLRELTPEFVTTRYPDAANGVPYELYDDTIATRFLRQTEEFFRWLEHQMPTRSGS